MPPNLHFPHVICLKATCERCGHPCYKAPEIDSVVKRTRGISLLKPSASKHHAAAHSSLLSSPHLTLDTCSSLCYSIACKVPLQVVGFEQVIVFPVPAHHLYRQGELTVSKKKDDAHYKHTSSRKGILTRSSVSSKI